jgi:hypothetical protein
MWGKFAKLKNIILPLILYGCEIWSLILRIEHRDWIYLRTVCRGEYLEGRGLK